MKRLIRLFVLSLALSVTALKADDRLTQLLYQLPQMPTPACAEDDPPLREFDAKVAECRQELETLLAKHAQTQARSGPPQEAKLREQMIKQSGLTPAQIQRIEASKKKGRKERDEAKRALANEMLQQYGGLSLEEVEQLRKMSPEARAAWKQAYTTQATATAQAEIQARSPEEQAAETRKQERLRKLADLARQQEESRTRATAGLAAVQEKLRALENEANDWYVENIGPLDAGIGRCRESIRELHGQRSGGSTDNSKSLDAQSSALSAQCEQYERLKTEALGRYCARFTPRHRDLVNLFLTAARAGWTEVVGHDEREGERLALLADSPDLALPGTDGALGFETVRSCLDLLGTSRLYAQEYISRPSPEQLERAAQTGAAP